MECPICGSDDFDILNSKQKSSKKPQLYRVIISKQGESIKTFIELSPNDELAVGDSLLTEEGQVEITSIETENKRVKKALVEDIVTIWANSVEIPARIGFSVDLHGEVDSYKLDLDRDFQISTEDIVKIDKHIVRIHVIKTQERKITSGFARAEVIKRVYGKPVKFNNFDYDLTKYIVKKTLSE